MYRATSVTLHYNNRDTDIPTYWNLLVLTKYEVEEGHAAGMDVENLLHCYLLDFHAKLLTYYQTDSYYGFTFVAKCPK